MVLVQKRPLFQLLFLGNIGQENIFDDILVRKNAFLGYKNKSSKSRKIDIFPKALPMVLVQKMAIFQNFFFQSIQAREMSLTIFKSEKTPLQAIKTRSSKRRKIDIFQKGLTHGFGPKMAIFYLFFQAIQARKMSLTIFQSEKTPLQAIKTRSKKSRKIDVFHKGLTHGFGPKMAIFSTFFLGQENVFYDTRQRKNAFVGYKTRSSKSRKIDTLLKGLTHGFGAKMAIFPTFFFQAIQAKKMSLTIFQRKKTPFQAIKTTSSNTRKIGIFEKGLTHGFGPKMAVFRTFCFQAIQARKMTLTIFQSEKTPLQAIKTRSSKSRKIDLFQKRVNPWFWSKNGHFSNFFFFWQYRKAKYVGPYSRAKKRLSRL